MILSIGLGTRKLRPLEARKRAERLEARRRVFVGRDDRAPADGSSNAARRRGRPGARCALGAGRGVRRGSRRARPVAPAGREPSARAYPCVAPAGRAPAVATSPCVIPPGVCGIRLATPRRGGVLFPSPEAPGRAGDLPRRPLQRPRDGAGPVPRCLPGSRSRQAPPIAAPPTRNPIERMDAKQVWRAALGELPGLAVARQLRDLAS